MRADMRRALFFFFAIALSSCGSQSITMPEDLPITTYKKDTAFTMTVVLDSCKDVCATYEPPSCNVEIDGSTIFLDVEVAYERGDEACSEVCTGQVLAHCDVSALAAGMYTVESGSFKRTIKVI
jgi:hypothetical protein